MDRRLVPPIFPNAPQAYDQQHMQDLIRSLNTLITQLQNPGVGRNSSLTITGAASSETGLEPGTLWDDLGIARFAGSGPEQLSHPSVYGQVSHITDATITITTAGQFVSTGITATLDTSVSEGLALGTTDTFALKNTTGRTIRTPVYGSIDATTAGSNRLLALRLALNGTSIPETECRALHSSAAIEAKLVTRWIVELDPDDEVSLVIANITNTNDITFKRGRIVAA